MTLLVGSWHYGRRSVLKSGASKYIAKDRSFFYRAMHFSAKRGLAIACHPSVRPSVYDVGDL